MLVPEYEGPISNPVSNQHTVLDGVMFVDCIATTGSQAPVGASIADITPSEAGAACDMSSSDHLDTALAALDNPKVARAPCLHCSASVMDVTPLSLCQPGFCFFDASDSLDYKATLAEALARLCKRASEDSQAQSASQAVRACQQQNAQEEGATPLSLSAAAAATDTDAANLQLV